LANEQQEGQKHCDRISKMFAAIRHRQSFAVWSSDVLGSPCSRVVRYNRYIKSRQQLLQLNRQIDDIRVARPHRILRFVAATDLLQLLSRSINL